MTRVAIGMDIGGTNVKAGIVGEDGRIVRTDSFPTEVAQGKPAIIRKLVDQARAYRQFAQAEGLELAGVGIGTAGYVDADGIVAGATDNIPGWSGTDLRTEVGALVGLNVSVDNDANALAIGEAWIGAGAGYDSFLCVTLGTGVGGCRIEGKLPFRGRDGFAGGYGHQIVSVDGLPCTCGSRGCWEQYASVPGLVRLAGGGASPERLFADAREGNAAALSTIDRYAGYIAVGLVNLIHIFNPPAIVVGGAVTAQGDFLFDRIRSKVAERAMPVYLRSRVPIEPALLGNRAGVAGAARLAFLGGRA